MSKHPLIATLLATAAVSGVAAGSASADSIAYIKNGDVWLTTGDASREFQVSSTGGYSAVAQSDDGTLLATAGGDLRRLSRYGDVLSDIKTPVSDDPGGGLSVFYGPFNADISPDGKTAAYGYVHSDWTTDSSGYHFEQRNGTGFSHADALTGFTDQGYKYSQDWDAPEFIDNQTVLVSDGPGYPSDPIAIETVGSGDPQGWFTDPDNPHPADATISADRRLIADVVGPARQQLSVYRDQDGQLLGAVSKCFTYSDSGTYKYESPTFNANGTMLYWSDGKELQIAPIGDMSTSCAAGLAGHAAIPGATSPDWGPADVPTSRPSSPTTTTSGPKPPSSPTSSGPKSSSAAKLKLLAAPKGKLGKTLKRGLLIQVSSIGAGTITVKGRVGKMVVAGGTARAAGAGRVTVPLRFTRAARQRYRHARRVTLSLTVAQGRQRVSTRVRLAR